MKDNKVEVDKDFIMEAYKSACGDWKKRIEDQIPELFRLTGGSWKVNTGHQNALVFYPDSSIADKYKETFAIHCNNGYSGKDSVEVVQSYNCRANNIDTYRDATLEDIFNVLSVLVKYPENFHYKP